MARFSELGVPAVNYGPGDPGLAHSRDEYVELAEIERCEATPDAALLAHRLSPSPAAPFPHL